MREDIHYEPVFLALSKWFYFEIVKFNFQLLAFEHVKWRYANPPLQPTHVVYPPQDLDLPLCVPGGRLSTNTTHHECSAYGQPEDNSRTPGRPQGYPPSFSVNVVGERRAWLAGKSETSSALTNGCYPLDFQSLLLNIWTLCVNHGTIKTGFKMICLATEDRAYFLRNGE